jgi:hypothetical protein
MRSIFPYGRCRCCCRSAVITFIYLTWGDVGDDGTFGMFRRAKLMLADLEPFAGAEQVMARIDLTDECGGPTCARLKPPALTLSPD